MSFVFWSKKVSDFESDPPCIHSRLGLNHLPVMSKTVETPTGAKYEGLDFEGRICGVSIMRAGEAMEQGLRECCR